MVKNLFISYFLWPFYLLHSPPAPHFEALQVLAFRMLGMTNVSRKFLQNNVSKMPINNGVPFAMLVWEQIFSLHKITVVYRLSILYRIHKLFSINSLLMQQTTYWSSLRSVCDTCKWSEACSKFSCGLAVLGALWTSLCSFHKSECRDYLEIKKDTQC